MRHIWDSSPGRAAPLRTVCGSLFAKAIAGNCRQALLLLLVAGACSVHAATTRTWTGGGGNDNWSEAANWGGTAPVAGDDLVFDGSTRLTPNNNFAADTSFNSITFNAGASSFTLGGNRITLAGSITNNSANLQTISLNIIQVVWQPTVVSPAGWYDASDATTITQVGGAVSQWRDKSVHGLHLAQGTGSKQPLTGSHTIGGLNAIYFNNASSQEMNTSSNPFSPTINNAFVIFAMNCRTITASTLFTLSGSGTSGNRWQSHAPWDNGSIYFDTGGASEPNRVSAASGWAASSNHLVSYYGSTADSVQQVYKDGSLLVGDATGHAVTTVGNIYLGSEVGTTYDNVDIGECIIVNGTVSTANRQRFEGYLANKWGLTASLPASHPFKTQAPYIGISINAASGDITITGTVTGSGDVTKQGTKKVTFSNATITAPGADILANGGGTSTTEFLGTTTVSASKLRVSINDAGNTVNIGGTAALTLGDFNIGDQPTREGTINQTGGTVTVTNAVRVGHWATETSTYNLSAGSLNLTGTSATSPYPNWPEYNGALYLGIDGTGNFNQSGGTVAAEGLVLDNRDDTAGTDTYTLTAGTLTLGKWGIQGNASSQIDLGGGTVGASANWSSSRPMTLTGTGGDTTFDTGANTISLSGALSSTGGLIKAGTGTLTLSTTNTYTGATTINAGTLLVNAPGSLAVGSAVAVNNGGTLGGSGTVNGAITLASNATVAPGSATGVIGTFTTPALAFVAGSIYSVDLDGATPTCDMINSTGTVDCGSGTLTVANVASMAVGKSFTIISAGSVTGTFNGMPQGSSFTVLTRTFRIIYTSTTVKLVDVTGGGYVWCGAGGDDNWSTGANWAGGVAPPAGANIIFSGSTRLTPYNNIGAGTVFNSITFSNDAGGFTVTGDALTLTAGATALSNYAASGTQTFSCPLTFSTAAPTISTVADGTLTVGSTIDNGGLLLTVNAAGPVNLNGAISGAGGLTKTGSNTLTLSGASTYGGTTTLGQDAGTLTLSGGNDRLPTTTTLALTGGTTTFDLGSNNQTISTLTTPDNVTTSLTITGSGSATLTMNGAADFTWGSGGLISANCTYTLNMSGLPNFVFNASANFFEVGYKSGATSNVDTISQTGLVTLAANNTITCSAFGVGRVSTGNRTAGTHTLRLGVTNTINADIVGVGSCGRVNATLNFNAAASSATFRATNGSSAVTSWKMDTWYAYTPDPNTFTNTANFSNGTIDLLVVDMPIAVCDIASANRQGTQTWTFLMGNGTLTVTGTATIGSLSSSGTGTVASTKTVSANGVLTINHASAVVSIATLTLATNTITTATGTARTVSGVVNLTAGTLSVTTLQLGAQTGNATSVTRTFNWTTGTIKNIAGADLTWTGVPITLASGTHTFDIESGRTATLNSGSPIGGAFTLAKAGAGSLTLAGVNTYSGATTISAGNLDILGAGRLASGTYSANISIASGSVFTYNSSANQTLQTGVISGAGSLVKNNTGTLTLTGTNTYTGTTTISAGTLQIGNAGTTGSLSTSSAITNNAALVFNRTNTITQGTDFVNVISGSGTVTQAGSGTLVLNGTNIYTGATTVNAGTLLVNAPGSLAVGSAVAVNNGGTLGGDGTVSGAITLASGGKVAPGAAAGVSIGTLGTANVTFVSGSTYAVDLDGTTPTFDKINTVSGTVDCSLATLKLASIANQADQKVYTIIQASSVTGTFNGLPDGASVEQLGRVFKITYTATEVVLTDLTNVVWDGGSSGPGDDNWTTAANWVGDIAPVTGSALKFAGIVRPTPTNNFAADTRFASITFNSGADAFTLGGNRITLTGDIVNNDDSLQTIDLDIIRTTSSWQPDQLQSLTAWYDAADAATITIATGVSQWNDKSGNNYHASQGTTSLQPALQANQLNGKPTIYFDGSGRLVETGSHVMRNLFIVCNASGTTFSNWRWAYGSEDGTDVPMLFGYSGTSDIQSSLPEQGSSNSVVKVNGSSNSDNRDSFATLSDYKVVSVVGGAASASKTSIAIGGGFADWIGNIAEVIDISAAVTTSDRDKIEGYLANKWGLTANLPATHPYRALGVNAASGDITINGIISGSLGLVKQGAYTVTLSGANTYTGKTSIQNGIVSVNTLTSVSGGASALGAPTTAATGTIAIGSTTTAATLVYTGTDVTTDRVIDLAGTTGGATIDQSGSGLLKFTSACTATGSGAKTLTLQGSTAGTGEVAGAIVNSGSATALTKAGSGTWTLSGVNTYTGTTTISGGLLEIGGAGQLGSGTYSANISIAASSTFKYNSSANQTLQTGVISGAGVMVKDNTGTLTLTGANTYTGTTSILNGALSINSIKSVSGGASAVGAPTDAVSGTIAIGSATTTGTLVYTGTGDTSDRVIDLAGTTGGATIDQSGTGLLKFTSACTATGNGAKTLTLQGSTAGTGEVNAAIVDGAGTTALTKAGTGTWTLSGVNTYTGATTVNAGTLLVNDPGSLAVDSAVAVNNGGTLGGNGTVSGAITLASGGKVAPGAASGVSIGTLDTAAVTFVSGSTYSVDLDGDTPDDEQINSSGTVNCGSATLTVASLANAADLKVYTIIQAGSVTGTFNGLPDGASVEQLGRVFKITYTGTTVVLTDLTNVVWDGGGGDDNWTTGDNWVGNIAPVTGSALQFAGIVQPTTNNDFDADTRFASITFNDGAAPFTLGGNRITLTGDIVNNDDSLQTIDLDIIRTYDAVWAPNPLSTVAWYDASDAATITQSGGAVSQWNDKSGNNNHATQGVGGSQPITNARLLNGLNVLDFSNAYMGFTSVEFFGKSVYVVAQSDDGTNNQQYLANGATANRQLQYNSRGAAKIAATANAWNVTAGSISVVNTGSAKAIAPSPKTLTYSFNAGSCSKLIVTVCSEGGQAASTVITYNGVALKRCGVKDYSRNVGVWYLDAPYTGGAANIVVDMTASSAVNGIAISVMSVSGTANGYSGENVSAAATVNADSTLANSLAVVAYSVNSGATITLNAPVTTIFAGQDIGSAYAAMGYANGVSVGTKTYTVTSNQTLSEGTSVVYFEPATTFPAYAVTNPHMLGFIGDSTLRFSINGTVTDSFSRTTSDAFLLNQIAARTENGVNNLHDYFDGMVGEIIIANTTTLAQRQKIEGYLANKWGLAANLPVDHPYRALIVNAASGNLAINGIISGSLGLVKQGAYTATLSGANTYTGKTSIQNGTVSVNTIKDADGTASALGAPTTAANGTIAIGSTTTAATLVYTGTGDTTDRVIDLAGTTGGTTIDQSGASGLLKFTSAFTATGSGAKTLTLQGSTAGTGELAGAVVNSGSATALTKAGTGTWTLSGTNTYTGNTTIGAGTLQLGSGGTTGALSTSSAISNNATLTFNRSNTITQGTDFNSVISGGGNVIQLGSGITVLNGANTYTGTTSIQAGTLSINSIKSVSGGASAVGAPITVGNGTIAIGSTTSAGTLVYTGGAQNTDRVIDLAGTTGGAVIDQSGTGLLKFTSACTATGSGAKTLTLQGSTAGTGEVNAAIVDGAGTTALTKAGSGIWTLSGVNTYTGATTVNAGTLQVTGSTAAGSAVAVNSGGTLIGSGTLAGTLAVNAGGSLVPGTGGTTINTLNSGALTFNATSTYSVDLNGTGPAADRVTSTGAVTCAGTLTVASNLNPAAGRVYTIASGTSVTGTFSGLSEGAILYQQGRTFQISYLGNTVTLTDVATRIWDGGSTGPGDDNWNTAANWVGDVAPVAGDHLQFAGSTRLTPNNNFAADTSFGSITFNSGAGAFVMGGNRITLAGPVTNNDDSLQTINLAMIMGATRTVDTASGNVTIGGILSGAGGLTESGAQTLTLSASNTYTGVTSIQNGAVSVNTIKNADGTASPLGAPTTAGSGTIALGSTTTTGTLVYTGTGDTTDRVIDLAGTTGGATITQSGTGLLQFTSACTATGSGAKTLTLQGSTAGTGEVAGAIVDSGGGATALTKAGSGTWTLSGTNTYTGATTLGGGVLSVATIGNGGVAGNLGQASTAAGNIVFNGGTLQYTGATASTDRNFTINAATTGTIEVTANTLTLSGADTATTGALTKTGAGTLVLSGANLHTGATTISAGTLQIGAGGATGALSTSSAITNDATLTFNRSDTVTQGTHFASVISGTGAVVQAGSGTLILTGVNTYGGGTTVNAGILKVTGQTSPNSCTGTGSVTVNAGGTLSGDGRIGGSVSVANDATAVLYPNMGATLTLGGNLGVAKNSTVTFDLSSSAAGSNDKVVLEDGTLSLPVTNDAVIRINCGADLDTTDYVLLDVGAGGTINNNFSATPVWVGTTPKYASGYTVTKSGTQILLHYTPIPITATADAKSKTYGNADPALTYQITSGALEGGDSFSGALTRVAGENVGTYAIQQGTLALSARYSLTYVGANLTINKRAITVTAVTDTKVYDDNTSSAGVPTITSGSLAAGDSVTWTQTFDTKFVGTGKTLTPAGTVSDGNGGNNYDVTFVNDTTGVITAGAASKLAFTTQPSASTVAGVAFATQPVVTVQDAFGNTVTGATNTIALTLTTGTGTLGATTSMDAVAGVADFAGKGLNINLVGTNKVLTASTAGLTSATTSPDFTVTAAAASKLAFTTQPSASTVAGVAFATQPVVPVQDAFGNTITGATNTIALTLTTGTGTLGGTTNMDAVAGVADFAGKGLNIDLVGTNKVLTASTAGLTSATTSPDFTITAAAASKLAFTTQPSASTVAGVAFATQPVVTVQDAFGNTITGATNTIALSLTTGTGALGGTTSMDAVAGVADFAGKGLNIDLVGIDKVLTASTAGLTSATTSPDFTITSASNTITVTAVTDTKIYDGTTNSVGVPTITTGALDTGDVATWTQTFDTKNVGINKTLTPAGTVKDAGGNDVTANYTITFVPVATGVITPRPLTVTATGIDKIYDGTVTATVDLHSNQIGGDTLVLNYSDASFNDPNVGTNKPVTVTGITIGGADAGNYNLQNTMTFTTANITLQLPVIVVQPAPVTVNVYDVATFRVTVLGTPPLTFQWRKNGVNIPGANAVSYTTPPVPASDNGAVYSIAVGNAGGSTISNGATLTVNVTGDGLTQTRYSDPNFTNVISTQVVPNVNTNGLPGGGGTRWTGSLLPVTAGTYHFYLRSNGGVRLWLDGVLVIDGWNVRSDTTLVGSMVLATGRRYTFQLDFAYGNNPGMTVLEWGLPGWGPVPGGPAGWHEVIPQSQFFTAQLVTPTNIPNGRPRTTNPEDGEPGTGNPGGPIPPVPPESEPPPISEQPGEGPLSLPSPTKGRGRTTTQPGNWGPRPTTPVPPRSADPQVLEPEEPTAPATGPGVGLVKDGGPETGIDKGEGKGSRSEAEALSERNESKEGTGNPRIPPYTDVQDPLAIVEQVKGAEPGAGLQAPGERPEALLKATGQVPFGDTQAAIAPTIDKADLAGSTSGTIALSTAEEQGPAAAAGVDADGNVAAPATTSLFDLTWPKGLLVIAALLLVAAWRVKKNRGAKSGARGWWLGSDG